MDFIRHLIAPVRKVEESFQPYPLPSSNSNAFLMEKSDIKDDKDLNNDTLDDFKVSFGVVAKDRTGEALCASLGNSFETLKKKTDSKRWIPMPKAYNKSLDSMKEVSRIGEMDKMDTEFIINLVESSNGFVDLLTERNGSVYFESLDKQWISIKREIVDTEEVLPIALDNITRTQIPGWKLDGVLEPHRPDFIVVSPEDDSEYHEIPALDWEPSVTPSADAVKVVEKGDQIMMITVIDEGDNVWTAIPNLDWADTRSDEEIVVKETLPLNRYFSRVKKLASRLMLSAAANAKNKQPKNVLKHLKHFCMCMDINKDSLLMMAEQSSGTVKDLMIEKKAQADAIYAEIFPLPPQETSKLIYDENYDFEKARKFVVTMLSRRLKEEESNKAKSLQDAALHALSVFNNATAKFNAEWISAVSDDDDEEDGDCKPPLPPSLMKIKMQLA